MATYPELDRYDLPASSGAVLDALLARGESEAGIAGYLRHRGSRVAAKAAADRGLQLASDVLAGNAPARRSPPRYIDLEAIAEPIPDPCPLCADKCGGGGMHHEHEPCEDCDCNPIGMTVVDASGDWIRQAAASSTPMTISHLVSAEGPSLVSGEGKAGKSTAALDGGCAYALGYDEWHGFPMRVDPERPGVLYIDAENARAQRGKRLDAWLVANDHPIDALRGRFFWGESPTFGIGGPSDGIPLWRRVQLAELQHGVRFGLVIVDNLSRVNMADDRNSESAMRLVFNEVEALYEYSGPCALLGHVSQGGAAVNRDYMQRGQTPPLEHTLAGSNVSLWAVDHAVVIMRAGEVDHPDMSLFSVTASRGMEASDAVWELGRQSVRSRIVGPNGEPLTAPVFAPGPFGRRTVSTSGPPNMRDAFVVWAAGRGWLTTDDCTPANGCPVKADTARGYLRDSDWCERVGMALERDGNRRRFRLGEEATA